MSSWASIKHKTTDCWSYNDRLKQHGFLLTFFDPAMVRVLRLTAKYARQRSFSDAALQIYLTLKLLFELLLQQTTGFVQSLQRLVGLDWVAPDFSIFVAAKRRLT
jgi:hypothetical protein